MAFSGGVTSGDLEVLECIQKNGTMPRFAFKAYLSSTNVSNHLAKLKRLDYIQEDRSLVERDGKKETVSFYRISPEGAQFLESLEREVHERQQEMRDVASREWVRRAQ